MANEMTLPYATLVTSYIINNITGDIIIFKTLPEDISETFSAQFDSTEVRGRSEPYYGYAGSDARSVSYSITLLEDVLGDKYMSTINKLRALVYPLYSGSLVIPPNCTITLGDMVRNMKAIVNSVSVSWSGTIIGDTNTGHYSKADISLDLTQISKNGIPTANNPVSF